MYSAMQIKWTSADIAALVGFINTRVLQMGTVKCG